MREDYQLICSVSGAENLYPNIAYQWTKNGGNDQTQVGANSNTLSFTPLQLSDAASYICTVTITSIFLAGDIVMADSRNIRIQGRAILNLMFNTHTAQFIMNIKICIL